MIKEDTYSQQPQLLHALFIDNRKEGKLAHVASEWARGGEAEGLTISPPPLMIMMMMAASFLF